ncbi:hypothetical protein [Glycomyces terrestris]|uniref:Integral membrane protein n=1 Tax=Glycomyces terrestris TaxID=2493553 RepID=A0A426UTL6_9ACTN|nr:hypothetical protein [Glycomyces terrestris]RRR97354.1 hypothetical protein EIW28_18255 [Glycomyces terrestris]
MNETDADMGAVTESRGDGARPWTLTAAAGVFWLLATGLVAAGAWALVQILTGDVDTASGAAGIALIAWLAALYYWFIGRRLLQRRDVVAQAVFQALLWLPVGYYLREAAHPVAGLAAWALAAAMLALVLCGPSRRAVGFGERRPFGE